MKRLIRVLIGVVFVAGLSAGVAAASCVVIEQKTARNIEVAAKRGTLLTPGVDLFVVDNQTGVPKPIARGKTDEHGHFVFRDLPPGNYLIASSFAPPYEFSFPITVEDRDGSTQLPLPLPPLPILPAPVKLSEFSGAVVEPLVGAVIADASVVVEKPDGSKTVIAKSLSDDLGRVKLDLPTGAFLVRMSHPGFSPVVFPVQITSEQGAWPGFRLTMFIAPPDECSSWGIAWNLKYRLDPLTKD